MSSNHHPNPPRPTSDPSSPELPPYNPRMVTRLTGDHIHLATLDHPFYYSPPFLLQMTSRPSSSLTALPEHLLHYIAPPQIQTSTPSFHPFTCPICLDDVVVGSITRVLPCAHIYHSNCISCWLQIANRCPCCSQPVAPQTTLTIPSTLTPQIPRYHDGRLNPGTTNTQHQSTNASHLVTRHAQQLSHQLTSLVNASDSARLQSREHAWNHRAQAMLQTLTTSDDMHPSLSRGCLNTSQAELEARAATATGDTPHNAIVGDVPVVRRSPLASPPAASTDDRVV